MAVLALVVYSAKKCNNRADDDNDGLVDYPNDHSLAQGIMTTQHIISM